MTQAVVTPSRRIVDDFVAVADAAKFTTSFYDVKRLIHSKTEILEAIIDCLWQENDEEIFDILKLYAFRLTFYQEDIGRKPLHAGGFDLERYDARVGAQQYSSSVKANKARAKRYDECLILQKDDLDRYDLQIASLKAPFLRQTVF